MSIYTKHKNSDLMLSLYLFQALNYLSDHASMTLFSVRKLNVGSSQRVFNPDGEPIADNVQLTMRSSSIGSNSVDCNTCFFFYRITVEQFRHTFCSHAPCALYCVAFRAKPFLFKLTAAQTDIGIHFLPFMYYTSAALL
jgi:hypothetical protein